MQLARFALLTAVLALVLVPSALASHQFTDIPDTHPFHAEIGILKDTNITSGCTTSTFCPTDAVKRQAMAAFIARALGLVIRPGETTQAGVPGSRVAMLDDDLSFAGTSGNVFAFRGPEDNVAGGFSGNSVTAGVGGATIAGGGTADGDRPNRVSGSYGSVGGGANNHAGNGAYATVAGGVSNTASGTTSVVAGGSRNIASGVFSAVPGGEYNEASGRASFAAGRNAHAIYNGSFHFGDGNWSGGAATYSPNEYSFSAHATGGVHFHTNSSGATTGCWIFPGGGSWNCSSDRNVKENFRAVDGKALLERVAKLPISSWNYKGQKDSFRHIGPMSQDFKAAFNVGEDDKSIAMVDADGVALAAIQVLYRQKNAEVTALKRQNAAQSDRIVALERSVATLMRKEDR